jgi:hypothetical protein
MPPSNRTLIIHAGGVKTGSSALQNYLELNAQSLEKCGVDYQNLLGISQKDKFTSGNGKFFYDKLISNSPENEICNIIESYFGKNNLAICSCEHFQYLKSNHWKILCHLTNTLDIKIHLVFCIRDAAPFFMSNYDQRIKRDGGSFPDSVAYIFKNPPWCHVNFLKEIERVTDQLELTVLHYDSHKDQMIHKFIELLQLKTLPPEPEPNFIVNRSLSKNERSILIRLNKKFGKKFSAKVNDLMVYAMPLKEVDRSYHPIFLQQMETRFSDDITWVNQRFFAGQPILKIIDKLELQESQSKVIVDEGTQVHDLVLDWAFNQIDTLERKQLKMQNVVIKDKDLQIAEQNLKIEALLNSISWKLTAPLRRFADYLRRIRSFLKPQPTKAPSSQA